VKFSKTKISEKWAVLKDLTIFHDSKKVASLGEVYSQIFQGNQ
jgi:hypothetical protein